MSNSCDRCGKSSGDIKVSIVPVEFPDGSISYVQLCHGCLRYAFKLVLEELLDSEESLAKLVDAHNVTRDEIFNRILDHIKN